MTATLATMAAVRCACDALDAHPTTRRNLQRERANVDRLLRVSTRADGDLDAAFARIARRHAAEALAHQLRAVAEWCSVASQGASPRGAAGLLALAAQVRWAGERVAREMAATHKETLSVGASLRTTMERS